MMQMMRESTTRHGQVFGALMTMQKIDLAALEAAAKAPTP